MPLLFAVTLFVSASLLFMVQPMVGRMILPLLGGSPAVWNACMVFFQALLLLGYLYAHHVSTKYTPRKQWMLHLAVLAAPVAVMVLSVLFGSKRTPIAVAESLAPSGDTSPFLAVMALMTVAIGVPFFVASTSAPLLQKWFAYTGHHSAKDPYYLYAASNAGSLISLLGYPLFIEPNLTVAGQAWLFAGGFAVLIGLIVACGRAAANPIGEVMHKATNTTAVPASIEPPPSTLRVLKWIALAFVPSSWMLGVTFYMTTDIASIPLLWVAPLALYLVTFIIAFGRVPTWFRLVIGNLAPVMILLLVFVMVSSVISSERMSILLFLHILTFFTVALMCHYELAHDRPKDVSHLTKFFLMMSVGGVLGGLFNALIAPLVFPQAYEYKVVIVIGCLLVPQLLTPATNISPELAAYKRKWNRILDFVFPALTGLAFWILTSVVIEKEFFAQIVHWSVDKFNVSQATVIAILLYAIPVMACFFYVDRPFRFALAVAVLLAINTYREESGSGTIYNERSFFGILKVEEAGHYERPILRGDDGRRVVSGETDFIKLVHGTTLHGTQIKQSYRLFDQLRALTPSSSLDAALFGEAVKRFDPRQEPLTYYHRTGPVGAMFYELRSRKNGADAKAPIAMVGLGTGSVSCYAQAGQRLTFYEIDPAVRKIVEIPNMVLNPAQVANGRPEIMGPFTYVDDAKKRGAIIDFRMGDARLKLKEDVDRKYALLLVDAFSSDSIPVHLLTKEAVALYFERITEDGLLALHISNKYVNLEPVVQKIAAELGVAARVWNDGSESFAGGNLPGKTASSWVALAKDEKTLGVLAATPQEQVLAFGTRNFELIKLLRRFGPDKPAKAAVSETYGGDNLTLEEFTRLNGAEAGELARHVRVRDLQKQDITLKDLMEEIFSSYSGMMFHELKPIEGVPLWTDDYSDVLRVMTLKEVQWVRRKLGLPTPLHRERDE